MCKSLLNRLMQASGWMRKYHSICCCWYTGRSEPARRQHFPSCWAERLQAAILLSAQRPRHLQSGPQAPELIVQVLQQACYQAFIVQICIQPYWLIRGLAARVCSVCKGCQTPETVYVTVGHADWLPSCPVSTNIPMQAVCMGLKSKPSPIKLFLARLSTTRAGQAPSWPQERGNEPAARCLCSAWLLPDDLNACLPALQVPYWD